LTAARQGRGGRMHVSHFRAFLRIPEVQVQPANTRVGVDGPTSSPQSLKPSQNHEGFRLVAGLLEGLHREDD
jgi:hypothetical protein